MEPKWTAPFWSDEMGKGQSPPLQLLEGQLNQHLCIPPPGRVRRGDQVLASVETKWCTLMLPKLSQASLSPAPLPLLWLAARMQELGL